MAVKQPSSRDNLWREKKTGRLVWANLFVPYGERFDTAYAILHDAITGEPMPAVWRPRFDGEWGEYERVGDAEIEVILKEPRMN